MKRLLVNIIAASIGFILTLAYQTMYSSMLEGEVKGVIVIILILIIGPIVFGLVMLGSAFVNKFKELTGTFLWVIAGLEIGFMVIGFRVLIQWYLTPDNTHLEPLFVAIGIGIATLEWSRQRWTDVLRAEESSNANEK